MDVFALGYTGLFVITFLSATLLPLSSELFLILMLHEGFDPALCLFFVSLGNSLGGLTNYGIGRLGNPNWLRKTGMTEKKMLNIEGKIQKYGSWIALFSWLPFIGDPLLVGLGYFRVHFIRVALFMIIGKLGRYTVLLYFYFQTN